MIVGCVLSVISQFSAIFVIQFSPIKAQKKQPKQVVESRKSSVRCKVEHAFRIIKCQFGYKKTVYRGLAKNENRLYAMFACANLYALAIAGRRLSTT